MGQAAAVGAAVSASDEIWMKASELLTPDKTIQRIEDKAKFIVSTVTLVGTLLTGLGLFAGVRLTSTHLGQVTAVASVTLATLSVVLAVGSLVVGGIRVVAPSNLAAVEAWYMNQIARGRAVTASGLLLVLAFVVGAVATGSTLTSDEVNQPSLNARILSDGKRSDVAANGKLGGLRPGQAVAIALRGIAPGGTRRMLGEQVSRAGVEGEVSVDLSVRSLTGYDRFDLTVYMPDRSCSLALPAHGVGVESSHSFICKAR